MMANLAARRAVTLVLLCTGSAVVVLDQAIVGVVLPALAQDLGFEASTLGWIANAYLIALGSLSLLGGRLADLLGVRRTLMIGFAALAGSSFAAAAAPSPVALVVARAVQGASAALVMPSSFALLTSLYQTGEGELRKAVVAGGAAAGVGGAAGVLLGGAFIEWASWRAAFAINVPIGIVAVVAARSLLPSTPSRRVSIDVTGGLLLTAGMAMAVFAIAGAPKASASQTVAMTLVAAAALLGFVVVQRARVMPLVPLSIFRAPQLAVGNVVVALLGATYLPLWVFLNLYAQQRLALYGLVSALVLLPMRALYLVLSIAVTRRFIERLGAARTLVLGLASIGAGLAILAHMSSQSSVLALVVTSLLGAFGMALAYVPVMMIATGGVASTDRGLASGLVSTSYQVGSALGLAVTTTLWSRFGLGTALSAAVAFAVLAIAVVVAVSRASSKSSAVAGPPPTDRRRHVPVPSVAGAVHTTPAHRTTMVRSPSRSRASVQLPGPDGSDTTVRARRRFQRRERRAAASCYSRPGMALLRPRWGRRGSATAKRRVRCSAST